MNHLFCLHFVVVSVSLYEDTDLLTGNQANRSSARDFGLAGSLLNCLVALS